jgi:iron(III) transport system permease protein
MNSRTRSTIAAGLLLAFLAWLILYPLVLVLIEGFHGPNGWTLDFVRQFMGRKHEAQALWNSLWISVATVVLAAGIGVPLAFLFWRFDFPGRKVLSGLVALPAVLPPLVGVIAFLFLYGESGFTSLLVQWLFRLDEPPWRLQGAAAILLVHAYSMYVYFYLFTRAGLASLDAALFEAAAAGAPCGESSCRSSIPHWPGARCSPS